MKKIILIILLLPFNCFGFGSSNMDVLGYPKFREMEPTYPYSRDRYSMERYRLEVEEYREKAEKYIKNANNDIESIEDAKRDVIRKANRVIQQYNSL